jgi:hypothetical protein
MGAEQGSRHTLAPPYWTFMTRCVRMVLVSGNALEKPGGYSILT